MARRLFTACLVNGVLDEQRARLVVERVIAAGPRGRFGILSRFERLVRLERDRRRARVESAAPLGEDLRTRVAADIAGRYGPGLSVSFGEDPSLIGGMRVRVGSDVFDESVRARLTAIEAALEPGMDRNQ